jgi:hypothetical protein
MTLYLRPEIVRLWHDFLKNKLRLAFYALTVLVKDIWGAAVF